MKPEKNELSDEIHEVNFLQNKLVDIALITLGILSIPALAAYLYEVRNISPNPLKFIYIGAVIIIFVTLIARNKLSFKIKSWIIIILIWAIALLLLNRNGIYGVGFVFFMMAIILAALLLGIRVGLMVMLVSALVITTMGFLFTNGVIEAMIDAGQYNKNPSSWLTDTIVLLLFSSVTIFTAGKTYRLLKQNITILNKRNLELEKSKNEALVAYHAKNEFLANMSHEVRTPINSIMASSDFLLNELKGKQNQFYVKIIRESSSNLLKLINQILDLSSIEADKFELDLEFSGIIDLMQNISEVYSPVAEAKGLDFIVEIIEPYPDFIFTDEIRLNTILSNLLDNAIKFTEEGYIKIAARTESIGSEDSINLIISVEDTGKGISAEFLDNKDRKFIQEDGQITRKYSGVGLGLSLSDKLVEKLNGKIDYDSRINHGTKVTVTFDKIKCRYSENASKTNGIHSYFQSFYNFSDYQFSNNEKSELQSVISGLTSEIYIIWEDLMNQQSILQIKNFINALKDLGYRYNNLYINNYAALVENALENFDVDEIQKLLHVYQQIIDHCKKSIKFPS